MAKKIYLSPSSQTENAYAAGNTTEAQQCRAIARAAAAALKRCGFDVICAGYGTMYTRVEESNAKKAALHIAIHTNAHNKKVSGTRIYCYSTAGEGYKASKAVFDVLAPLTPGTSENITAKPELYEVKATAAPCVYIEVDFHDVPAVASWLVAHGTEVGEAICKGVCKYYGATYLTPDFYTQQEFVRDVQKAIGATVTGTANPETLSKTVTVGRYHNRKHPVVKPIQKRLEALGYAQVGSADGIAGKAFQAAAKAYQHDRKCWAGGKFTKKGRAWKKLLEME